jgi:hypothetical protein
MKAKQPMTTSTQQQISDQPWVDCPDPWNLRGRLPMTPVWKDKLKRPNPPTPEAVARAQFVDKTYVWKEPGKTAKPS